MLLWNGINQREARPNVDKVSVVRNSAVDIKCMETLRRGVVYAHVVNELLLLLRLRRLL